MKKLRNYLCAAAVMGCMVAFTSCGSDNSESEPDPVTPVTPEESKEYLEDVAKSCLNIFNPDDHREVIELANYFSNHYGDLGAPEEWEEDDDYYYSPASVMNALKSGIAGNPLNLTRAMSNVYDFDRYAGIYEPGRYSWEKVSNSDKIIFRFNGPKGNCELTVASPNGNWDASEYADGEKVYIPKTVNLTLTQAGNMELEGTLTAVPDFDAHTVNVDYDVKVANIRSKATLNGTDARISMSASATVGGSTLATASASVDGHDLCNIDRLTNRNTDLTQLVNRGVAEVDVLQRMQVKGSVSNISDIIEALDGYYDNYDYDSKDDAKRACQRDCDLLNRHLEAKVYYNTSAVQAHLSFIPEFDEYNSQWYSWWEWYSVPVIAFPDGTTYEFESYFCDGKFMSVENMFENLCNSYENLWR